MILKRFPKEKDVLEWNGVEFATKAGLQSSF